MSVHDAARTTSAIGHPSGRTRLVRAWLIGASLGLVIIVAQAQGNIHRTATGDGAIYRYIAHHLTIDPDEVDPVVSDRGTSLRYGRIGLPAAIWLLGGGNDAAIPYAHAAIMVLGAGAASAAAAALLPGAGPLIALLPFIVPGFAVSIAGGFADAIALALGLWAVRAALAARWSWTIIALASAILVKESALVLVAGLGLWLLLRSRPGPAIALGASVVPLAVWSLVVRAKYGHVPMLDPYLRSTTTTVMAPVAGLARSLTSPASIPSLVSTLVHAAAGIACAALARTSVFAVLGAVAALPILAAGPFAWRFIGESARVMIFLEAFAIMAVAAAVRPAWAIAEARSVR